MFRTWLALMLLIGCQVDQKLAPGPDGGVLGPGEDPVDVVVPDTTITEAPAAFSALAEATFRFTSNEQNVTFECRVDGEPVETCGSPYVRPLGDGEHSFSVRAIDQAGNADETPAEHLWSIDTVAPETELTDGPDAVDNSVWVRFEFRSGENNVSFECTLDNAGYLPCTSGDRFGPLGDGQHVFLVRAKDRAGNLDATPAQYTWAVDTSTPDTEIVSGPTGATSSTSATFTFISPDAGGGAVFQCSLDDGAWASCSSPKAYAGLAQREHTFAVRVRDAVGNFDPTPATRTWTVDRDAPNTTIVTGPSGATPVASASFTFTADEPNASFACNLDGAGFMACTSPFTASALGQGNHTFAVRATDAAGNVDDSPATRSWSVDTVPPVITFTSGPANNATTGPRVRFVFTVSGGGMTTCSLDGAAASECDSPLAASYPAGAHELVVRAVDAAGNTAMASRSWTVACEAPAPAGALGLLHLDDGTSQVLANAVANGASATLGTTIDPEPADPAALATARFGGGLSFNAGESDQVTWPITTILDESFSLELWARPTALAGTRDLLVSADERIALRVVAAPNNMVRFSLAVREGVVVETFEDVVSAPVAAGQWHHVIGSLDEPQLRLWVDGVETDTNGINLGPAAVIQDVRIGGGAMGFGGDLDEIWLSETAITNADMALERYCPL
ncbi:MAG: LamG-like jellyroll fold domain-containing protein [Kofleriaceae bacterium]